MTSGYATSRSASAISPRISREVCCRVTPSPIRGRRECRTLGASAAACAVVESTRVSHHGHAGNVRHSPRSGFNGFLRALPGDRACLPPSPLRSLLLGSLMPASGHQDHTTSPSASTRARQSRGSRPPHPAPTFVTMANAPLRDRTGQVLKVIWGSCEGKYFCKRDWTTTGINTSTVAADA